ncbi:enhancer of rudimentary [Fennellomyces sp. T-0311]|nr:enhancer of rudimentary [Fennellomyces sp. T-0311]
MTVHTILLTQPGSQVSSRIYYDFDTITAAMDHIASLYEAFLQRENPGMRQIQYRANDLLQFIDSYKEFVALILDPNNQIYVPKSKEWLKSTLIDHLSNQQRAPPQQQQFHQRNPKGYF